MKRGQIKIGENIAIFVVFFFILILGIVFYMRVQEARYGQVKEEELRAEAIEVAQKVSALPELQCSQNNVVEEDCVDLYKAKVLNADTAGEYESQYYDILGFASINLHVLNEQGQEVNNYDLFDNTGPNPQGQIISNIPVSVYNATSHQYGFGYLEVGVYRQP